MKTLRTLYFLFRPSNSLHFYYCTIHVTSNSVARPSARRQHGWVYRHLNQINSPLSGSLFFPREYLAGLPGSSLARNLNTAGALMHRGIASLQFGTCRRMPGNVYDIHFSVVRYAFALARGTISICTAVDTPVGPFHTEDVP